MQVGNNVLHEPILIEITDWLVNTKSGSQG